MALLQENNKLEADIFKLKEKVADLRKEKLKLDQTLQSREQRASRFLRHIDVSWCWGSSALAACRSDIHVSVDVYV